MICHAKFGMETLRRMPGSLHMLTLFWICKGLNARSPQNRKDLYLGNLHSTSVHKFTRYLQRGTVVTGADHTLDN